MGCVHFAGEMGEVLSACPLFNHGVINSYLKLLHGYLLIFDNDKYAVSGDVEGALTNPVLLVE